MCHKWLEKFKDLDMESSLNLLQVGNKKFYKRQDCKELRLIDVWPYTCEIHKQTYTYLYMHTYTQYSVRHHE